MNLDILCWVQSKLNGLLAMQLYTHETAWHLQTALAFPWGPRQTVVHEQQLATVFLIHAWQWLPATFSNSSRPAGICKRQAKDTGQKCCAIKNGLN